MSLTKAELNAPKNNNLPMMKTEKGLCLHSAQTFSNHTKRNLGMTKQATRRAIQNDHSVRVHKALVKHTAD
ncbi:MAG: hypothetical protein CTY31_03215 [Hyphomicrobium sp.]|nr:MAG: hypothetical protein CTY39_08285 [Hyphomicrobium sp.]PPD01764.1 MAG: hypothetical protein CTY31_03215 [Hyphomicrobium sp.]